MIVGICLGSVKGDVQRGSVISSTTNKPARTIRVFQGRMILLDGPRKFVPGYRAVICAHGIYVSGTVTKLIHSFNKTSGAVIQENPEYVDTAKGEGVLCEIVPTQPIVLESFKEFASLGRFAFKQGQTTIAV